MSKLIIFSGAGLSAESGISTFRGQDGTWDNHNLNEVCDILTWKDNFEKVHSFYNDRRTMLQGVEPNVGHRAIAKWQTEYETVLITQNIDDLLERAGCHDVIHLHGRSTYMSCQACGREWDIGYTAWNSEVDRCPKCNSRKGVKPGVVFFNEIAPLYRVLDKTLNGLTAKDVCVVIGTSSIVINISSMLYNKLGFKIINNLEYQLGDACYDEMLYMPISKAVTEIDVLLKERLDR